MGFKCGIVGLPNVGKSTLFNALTQTAAAQAANYPFCTIEPNVGEIAVPDPAAGRAGEDRQVGADRPDAADLRGHRRPGARRLQGRGPRQPVPGQHPRGRRRRPCGALLRGRRRHPCRGPRRSARRHRDDRDRADARRPRQPGKARRCADKKAKGSDKEAKETLDLVNRALVLLREGKPARLLERKPEEEKTFRSSACSDRQAGALRLQCRRGLGRRRQRALTPGPGEGQGRGRRGAS